VQNVYEKLGLFYFGKDVDKSTLEITELLTVLKNKNFTTHAAIIGMTGSGKTGLGIDLIEEAAIDNIPSIVIDPKGDMGNLCLTDASFSPKSFKPWVKDEANSKAIDVDEYAKQVSTTWKNGIESWNQDSTRVEKFQDVKKTIYTPGSSAGVSINIMSSLDKPSSEVMEDSDSFSSYLKSTVVSLLSLIGIKADPLDSKEYIFLAQIISRAWILDEAIAIDTIISKVINPPFKKIGVLPLDDFYSKDERFKLAIKFNSLLASPSFSSWLQGDNLDIQKLLYDENGKAKIAIISIAHLNDDERMFFVTILLNKYISWMRQQSGTTALKTILYMDEIFGFFPPSKNPPSKEPMLLLLKQARAFGVGVVLSTQNPVDLDYKGLSNIGTWFIGRLQTTQDIDRVIDGLGGQIGSNFTKSEIRNMLSNLKKRTFFLKSAHLEDIRLFSTRWTLSYLKGPLNKSDISILMSEQKNTQNIEQKSILEVVQSSQNYEAIQNIDDSIPQYYELDVLGKNNYYPTLMSKAVVHFFNQRRAIDEDRDFIISLDLNSRDEKVRWINSQESEIDFEKLPHKAPSNAKFQQLPAEILEDIGLKQTIRSVKDYFYQEKAIELYRCKSPKLESKISESKADFIVRLQDLLNNKKEIDIEKLKGRYESKETTLSGRILRAKQRVEKESADTNSSMIDAGIAVLGALFGRKTPTKIGRAFKKSSDILKERSDVSRAKERLLKLQDDLEALEYELEDKIDSLSEKYSIDSCEVEMFKIKPRKSDIEVLNCAIVWRV